MRCGRRRACGAPDTDYTAERSSISNGIVGARSPIFGAHLEDIAPCRRAIYSLRDWNEAFDFARDVIASIPYLRDPGIASRKLVTVTTTHLHLSRRRFGHRCALIRVSSSYPIVKAQLPSCA